MEDTVGYSISKPLERGTVIINGDNDLSENGYLQEGRQLMREKSVALPPPYSYIKAISPSKIQICDLVDLKYQNCEKT